MSIITEGRSKARKMFRAGERVVTHRQVADMKNALGLGKSVRFQQALVTEVSSTENTCSLQLAGENVTTIDGVHYFDVLPCPNYGAFVATDGEDLFVLSSQGPAPVIQLGRTTDDTTGTSEEDIIWEDPMSGGVPSNNGYDWWDMWLSGTPTRAFFPVPGVWQLHANVYWTSGQTTGRQVTQIKDRAGTSLAHASMNMANASNTIYSQTAVGYIDLDTANTGGVQEYVTVAVFTGEAAVDVENRSRFRMQWCGLTY